MTSEKLRQVILREFEALWNRNPHPKAIIIPQDLLIDTLKKHGLNYEDIQVQAALSSLVNEGYLEAVHTAHPKYGPDAVGCRITPAGRQYLKSLREQRFTRTIAIVGAVTGFLGLFLSLIALIY